MVRAIIGVTDLFNIKLSALGLFLGAMIHADSFAENIGPVYNYQPANPQVGPYAGYRWRPSGSGQPQSGSDLTRFRSGAGGSLPNAQTPMSQYQGNYRPIEQQPVVDPQVGAYRFRAVSPEDQSRSESTDIPHQRVKTGRYAAPPKFRNADNTQSSWSSDVKQKFRFRPDQRFFRSNEGSDSMYMSDPSQSLPPVYATPVFRDQDSQR